MYLEQIAQISVRMHLLMQMFSLTTRTVPWWDNNLSDYSHTVIDAIAAKNVSMGVKTLEFERLLSHAIGSKYCVCFPSGTAAITAALMQFRCLNPNIYLPNRTWIGTANAASMQKNNLILVDSCESSQNINATSLGKNIQKFSSDSSEDIVIYVPINGSFFEVEKIMDHVAKFECHLVVDGCQAFASNPTATTKLLDFGSPVCYSFGMPKLLSTGLGGCIATNSRQQYYDYLTIRNQGLSTSTNFTNGMCEMSGFNFKYTDLQACIGIEQIHKLDEILIKHLAVFSHYDKLLPPTFNITRIGNDNSLVPLRVELISDTVTSTQSFLASCGIETSLRTDNIIDHPYYKNYASHCDLSNSSKFSNKILVLPSGPMQSLDSVAFVCKSLTSMDNI